MIFGSKHQETAKLGPQRMTVKSSEVDYQPLSAKTSINANLETHNRRTKCYTLRPVDIQFNFKQFILQDSRENLQLKN